MVALTGRASPADEARAREVGFAAFLTKLDRDALLAALRTHLAPRAARVAA